MDDAVPGSGLALETDGRDDADLRFDANLPPARARRLGLRGRGRVTCPDRGGGCPRAKLNMLPAPENGMAGEAADRQAAASAGGEISESAAQLRPDLLRHAHEHLRAQRLDAAEEACREVLARGPENTEAAYLL